MTRWQRFRVWFAYRTFSDITLRASNGVAVSVSPGFARDYWNNPEGLQETLDSMTIRWED